MQTTFIFNHNNFKASSVSQAAVNQEVAVTSLYFRGGASGRHIKGYPKRMEYQGREYTFLESGLRYLIRKGQQLIEVFDMTDGTRDFRLRFDTSGQWTLVGIKAVQAGR